MTQSAPKANILLVDDKPENLVALEAVLDGQDLNLVKALSGRDALRHVLEQDFAVILLDVMMPEMDGFETAELIRQRERSRSTPIIFVTAVGKSELERLRGYALGGVDYLLKPFNPEILRSKVRVFTELFAAREALRQARDNLDRQVEERTAELRKSQQTLHDTAVQLRGLLEAITDAVFEIDAEGTIRIANAAAHRVFGWPAGTLIGQNIVVIVPPEQRERHQAGLRRFLETGEGPFIGTLTEVSGFRHDGAVMPCELSLAALTHRDQSRRFVGIVRDISARKRADERIRMLAQANESATEGIAMADPQAVITYANPAFARMFGYERDEVLGRHVSCFYPPEWREKEFPTILAATQAQGWAGEVTGLRKDGTRFPRWILTSSIRDPDGRHLGMLSISRDITEQRRMERHSQRLEQLATLGQLVSGIAHEIKNPLFIVTGRLQLLREKLTRGETDRLDQDFQKIEDAAQRMTGIVQRFLALARPWQPALQVCSVPALLQRTLDFVANELMVSHITVVTRFAADLPSCMVDPAQLSQAFLNLIMNAMQAMSQAHGHGTLTVSAALAADAEKGRQGDGANWIEVRIQDDGPGIAPEHRGKLFEPFFSTKPPEQGTGLGLWTVRMIVTAARGSATCETEAGKGATFIVRLPVSAEVKKG